MSRVLVFDVNETLLDLRALEPHFARLFGDKAVMLEWFNQVILFSEAVTLAGNYKNFGEVARAALEMMAAAHGKELSADTAQQIIGGIRNLPPHPEVPESLARLQAAGFQMVALTNSPPAVAEAQITNANLKPFFGRIFSVDSVQRFKPAPEPYRMVARELDVETSQLRMIAAHAWDVGGAMQAGCSAAFVARPGKALFPAFPKPDIIGHDLRAVAEAILVAESASKR